MLGIVASHPIQYYAPLFRKLSDRTDIFVFYGQLPDDQQQADAGFGVKFQWDVDLFGGYPHTVLTNTARRPSLDTFFGCSVEDFSREFKARQITSLLVIGWYQKMFWQAIGAAKRCGIPVMVRGDSQLGITESKFKKIVKRAAYPALLRKFDAALYVGQKSREYYEHYHYPKRRLFHSPHCVDTDRFAKIATPDVRLNRRRELGIKDSTFLVLFAGKLVDFKRPLDVIHAVARLRMQCSDVEVLIAGAGPLQEALNLESERQGVPTHFLGFCNQSEMPEVYAASDVLVLPSTGRETWGLVANEALATGTRIIVSDACGCAQDLCVNDKVGKIYRCGHLEELSAALLTMKNATPDFLALRDHSQKFSLDAAVGGIIDAMGFIEC